MLAEQIRGLGENGSFPSSGLRENPVCSAGQPRMETVSRVRQTGAKLPACSTMLRSRSFLFCARKPSLQENMRRRLQSLFSGPENRILPALKRILRAQASFFLYNRRELPSRLRFSFLIRPSGSTAGDRFSPWSAPFSRLTLRRP